MRDAIVRELVETVKEVAGEEFKVESRLVSKNNEVQYQAIIIRKEGEVLSPTIYVDRFIDDIGNKEATVQEVAENVFRIYQESRNPGLLNIEQIGNKQYILEHVEYQLVNAKRNQQKLQGAPSKKIVDLAVLYRVVVVDEVNGIASYIVTDKLMSSAQISIEELDEAAKKNSENIGFEVKSIEEFVADIMLDDLLEIEEEKGPRMIVLTNKRRNNGANILLYKDVLKQVAEKLDDDFFILPSSIHEVIAVPVSDAEYEYLKQMVQEVNDTEVEDTEIL